MTREKKRINPFMRYQGGWVPNWLLRREEVSPSAKLLYARLMQYAGEDGSCFPKVETLAVEIAVSERQVARLLDELEKDYQLIERDSGRLAKGAKVNEYFFLEHEWEEVRSVKRRRDTDPADQSDTGVRSPLTVQSDTGVSSQSDIRVQPNLTRTADSRKENQGRDSWEENHLSEPVASLPGERSSKPKPVLSGQARGAPEPGWLDSDRKAPSPRFEMGGPSPRNEKGSVKIGPAVEISGDHEVVERPADERLTVAARVIEEARTKAAAAAVSRTTKAAKAERQKDQLAANRKGAGSWNAATKRAVDGLFGVWLSETRAIDPEARVAWAVADRDVARKLIEMYDERAIADSIRYVIRNWTAISARYFKGNGDAPTIQLIHKLHARLVDTARKWTKYAAVLEEWDEWWKQDASVRASRPPRDLQARYDEAKIALGSLV